MGHRGFRDTMVGPEKSTVLMRMCGGGLNEKSVALGMLTNKQSAENTRDKLAPSRHRFCHGGDHQRTRARTIRRRLSLCPSDDPWREDGRPSDARFALTIFTQSAISAIYNLIAIRILHRHSTKMSLRDSISKPFKSLKRRLAKGSRKRGEGTEREDDTEGSGTGQSSRLHLETEGVVESGPSQKENEGEGKNVVQVDPPTSTPSIDNERPDGERTKPSQSFLP